MLHMSTYYGVLLVQYYPTNHTTVIMRAELGTSQANVMVKMTKYMQYTRTGTVTVYKCMMYVQYVYQYMYVYVYV